jgi:antitoxin PrlF
MRITSKGQVTIPQEIRTRAGLLPHTEVEFAVRGKTVILRKVKGSARGRGARVIERMRGRGTVKMTTDEIMALTRGD